MGILGNEVLGKDEEGRVMDGYMRTDSSYVDEEKFVLYIYIFLILSVRVMSDHACQ